MLPNTRGKQLVDLALKKTNDALTGSRTESTLPPHDEDRIDIFNVDPDNPFDVHLSDSESECNQGTELEDEIIEIENYIFDDAALDPDFVPDSCDSSSSRVYLFPVRPVCLERDLQMEPGPGPDSQIQMDHGSNPLIGLGSVPQLKPGPDSQMDHGSDPLIGPGSVPQLKPGPDSQIQMDHGCNPLIGLGSVPQLKPGPDSQMDHGSDPLIGRGSVPQSKPGPDSQMNHGSDPLIGPGSVPQSKPGPDSQMDHGSDPLNEPGSVPQLKPGPDSQMEHHHNPQMEPRSDSLIEPDPNPQPCHVSKKRKPQRPCMYCGKPQTQLARHLKRVHKDEMEVKDASKLPRKERLIAFNCMKKKGIFAHNIEVKKRGTNNLERERSQGSGELAMCNGCRGFYSQKRIAKHKKTCSDGVGTKSGSLNARFLGDSDLNKDEFHKQIIQKFRIDKTGALCQTVDVIIRLGRKLWAKSARKDRRVIMNDMRTLGNLVIECRKVAHDDTIMASDIVRRENFDHLTQAIQNLTHEYGQLKAGLKLAIGFLLKKLIKVLKGIYIQENSVQQATEIDNFAALLDLNWEFIFYRAQLVCEQRRQNLRKPVDMPLERDLTQFRNFLLEETEKMTNDNFKNWDRHDFIYMRNLLVSRLTLFNARRGGEPARMLLSEFTEAQKGAWIDQQQVESIDDPLEKELVDNMKLAYQSGKGSRRLVPVLFPKDTLPAVERLITVRKECGVADQNMFLFPNTGLSTDHVIGWNSIQSVAKLMGDKLEKPHLLIADKFRHRASTLFALLEMPGEKREMFYRHMGHSEQMNRDVYQSPLAIREMTEVGSFLQRVDMRTSYETIHLRLDKCQGQEDASTSQQAIERNTAEGTESPPYQDIVTEQQISELQNCDSTSGDANGAHSNHKGGDDDDCDDDLEECSESRYRRASAFNKNRTKQRRYFKWSKAQAETVRDHFRAVICNNTMMGTKGALPGKKHVETFLKETGIFQNIKISLIKTKIFNERTKERALLEKLFD